MHERRTGTGDDNSRSRNFRQNLYELEEFLATGQNRELLTETMNIMYPGISRQRSYVLKKVQVKHFELVEDVPELLGPYYQVTPRILCMDTQSVYGGDCFFDCSNFKPNTYNCFGPINEM